LESNHKVIRITDESRGALARFGKPPGKPQVETVVQVDISEQWRDHAIDTKDNFEFERQIEFSRSNLLLDMRRKG
jgi:hypothetical protein